MISRAFGRFVLLALFIASSAVADKIKKRDTIASLEGKSVEVRPGPAPPTSPGPTENQYSFTDLRGLPRTERMPPGIRIVSSTSPVVFRPNGTLDAEALTVLEVQTRQGLKTWEVRTSRMGVTRVID